MFEKWMLNSALVLGAISLFIFMLAVLSHREELKRRAARDAWDSLNGPRKP